MKKIIIQHVENSYNYGSLMMAINFVEYFSRFYNKDIKFFVDTNTGEDLERLKIETLGRYQIEKFSVKEIKYKKKSFFNKFRTFKTIYFKQVNDIVNDGVDAVVILGGDDLSEYYGGWRIIYELYKIYRISKKVPVFLVGQTIGPFYSWRKIVANLCLKKCYIYLRDDKSYNYLENKIKLNNLSKFRDLAFLNLPRQERGELFNKALEKYCLEKNNYISVIPSGAQRQYTSSFEEYIKTWAEIIKNLIKNSYLDNKKIVLLSHVAKPEKKSDGLIIRNIIENIDQGYRKKIIVIAEPLLASEARAILGNGIFTITGRMHGAVSTFQMGKPAISLSYSVKYMGVIGEGLGREDLIIEAKGNDLWKEGKMVKIIDEKINYLINNYKDIQDRLKVDIKKNQDLVINQIKDVVKKINTYE